MNTDAVNQFLDARGSILFGKAVRYGAMALGVYVTTHHLITDTDLVNEIVGTIIASAGPIWTVIKQWIDHRDGTPAVPPAPPTGTPAVGGDKKDLGTGAKV